MNATRLRLAFAQVNLLVGDIGRNVKAIQAAVAEAHEIHRADAVIFPELAVISYPPDDLLLRPALWQRVDKALNRIAAAARGIDVILGFPEREAGQLFNACALLRDGRRAAVYRKQILPNYGVFDEKRFFAPGDGPCVIDLKGIPAALTVCEDIWQPEPAEQARQAGARLLININASPYHADKLAVRRQVMRDRVHETGLPIVYANLIGGQDELVFDGGSMVMDSGGELVFSAPQFAEGLFPVTLVSDARGRIAPERIELAPPLEREESIYRALVLGVRDYVHKNGFSGAVLGLSGGIDSALTLCIAVDALGAGNVEALIMPSRYTAAISVEDARALADNLGVRRHELSIEGPFRAFTDLLQPVFAGLPADTTEENIQARCRGILLMAYSNKTGRMVLATGNKSELSVGYATLYGDMAGGFAPLKDVVKTLVYRLAAWRNREQPLIPRRIFDRPPTAELKPDQTDQDTLPPYELLDPILERYIERDQSPEQIIAAGYEAETVRKVVRMVDRNEYKRRQAAPGVKISERAFGRERRYPITSGYDEFEG